MSNVKISVIVPVYNASRYLENCVNSITSQDFTDFEVILVDDCSPDNSGEICDRLAKSDNRIKVIHKEKNEGPGNARRTGLEIAKGDWVAYSDSDDWFCNDAFEKLSRFLNSDADIIAFGMNMCKEDKNGSVIKTERIVPLDRMADSREKIGDMLVSLDKSRVFQYMWNKLYRMSFLKVANVDFDGKKIMEDFYYNIKVFDRAKKVISISEALYNYRKPQGETLTKVYHKNYFELVKKRYIYEKRFVKGHNAFSVANMQDLQFIFIKHLVSCFMKDSLKVSGLTSCEKKEQAKQYLNDGVTLEVMDSYKPTSKQIKILFWIYKHKKYALAVFTGSLIGILKREA